MNKFIEITAIQDTQKHLINTEYIEEVIGSTIFFAFTVPHAEEQDYILCEESYEEIKTLIRRARKENG